jgi:hypothetical protein
MTRLWGEQPRNRGSIVGNDKRRFSSAYVHIGYAAHPVSY